MTSKPKERNTRESFKYLEKVSYICDLLEELKDRQLTSEQSSDTDLREEEARRIENEWMAKKQQVKTPKVETGKEKCVTNSSNSKENHGIKQRKKRKSSSVTRRTTTVTATSIKGEASSSSTKFKRKEDRANDESTEIVPLSSNTETKREPPRLKSENGKKQILKENKFFASKQRWYDQEQCQYMSVVGTFELSQFGTNGFWADFTERFNVDGFNRNQDQLRQHMKFLKKNGLIDHIFRPTTKFEHTYGKL